MVAILTNFDNEWLSVQKEAKELKQFGEDLNAYQIVGNYLSYHVFDKTKRNLNFRKLNVNSSGIVVPFVFTKVCFILLVVLLMMNLQQQPNLTVQMGTKRAKICRR